MRILVPTIAAVLVLASGFTEPANAESARTALNPSSVSASPPYGYSQANVVRAGTDIVYVAGQVGIAPDGPNDFASQVDRSFDNMVAVLNAAGADAGDVVRITLLIADHDTEKLAYLVKKRREVFGDAPPASTLIPVTRLYADGVSFEIDAIAVLD